jgi:hypothetical protein
MNNDNTILTLANDSKTVTTKMSWDCNMEELIDAFYGACIALTWNPVTILETMEDYAQQHLAALSYSGDLGTPERD